MVILVTCMKFIYCLFNLYPFPIEIIAYFKIKLLFCLSLGVPVAQHPGGRVSAVGDLQPRPTGGELGPQRGRVTPTPLQHRLWRPAHLLRAAQQTEGEQLRFLYQTCVTFAPDMCYFCIQDAELYILKRVVLI